MSREPSPAKELSGLDIAELIFDVVPPTMRRIRTSLRESAQGELTHPQLRILAHVRRGTETAAELAERQGVSTVAISKMVEVLVSRGLLERTYRNGNRKQVFLRLTESGTTLFLKVRKAGQKKLAKELADAAPKDKQEIARGLEALRRVLKG